MDPFDLVPPFTRTMEPFDLVQAFIEKSAEASSPLELSRAFQSAVEQLGFHRFACYSHVDCARPPPGTIILHNYPPEWGREYVERRLYEVSPIRRRAEQSLLPFRWHGAELTGLTEGQRIILAKAAALRIGHGYTIPLHFPWRSGIPRASCTLVPDSSSISERSFLAAQLMATHLYAAALRLQGMPSAPCAGPLLSLRERQCLELAAQGKDDWTIGQLLKLSEHTVHGHLERAKRRLGVATRIQAVVYALEQRQISFGDVIRADLGTATSQHDSANPRDKENSP